MIDNMMQGCGLSLMSEKESDESCSVLSSCEDTRFLQHSYLQGGNEIALSHGDEVEEAMIGAQSRRSTIASSKNCFHDNHPIARYRRQEHPFSAKIFYDWIFCSYSRYHKTSAQLRKRQFHFCKSHYVYLIIIWLILLFILVATRTRQGRGLFLADHSGEIQGDGMDLLIHCSTIEDLI